MREIMFRGKRKDNGEWETGSLVMICQGLSDEQVFITDQLTGVRIPVSPDTVGQYTGLRDKNGKKIFEGDICRNSRTGEVVSVHWHGTMAGFVWSKRKSDGTYLYDWGELFRAYDKYEIIGNIQDNPELLRGGDRK